MSVGSVRVGSGGLERCGRVTRTKGAHPGARTVGWGRGSQRPRCRLRTDRRCRRPGRGTGMNGVTVTTSVCIKSIREVNIQQFGKLSLLWRDLIECPRGCSLLGDRRRLPVSADEEIEFKIVQLNPARANTPAHPVDSLGIAGHDFWRPSVTGFYSLARAHF